MDLWMGAGRPSPQQPPLAGRLARLKVFHSEGPVAPSSASP
jgi:hypothetical protein